MAEATVLTRAATRLYASSDPFDNAVACWLEEAHQNLSTYNSNNHHHAFAVARAYLGESS